MWTKCYVNFDLIEYKSKMFRRFINRSEIALNEGVISSDGDQTGSLPVTRLNCIYVVAILNLYQRIIWRGFFMVSSHPPLNHHPPPPTSSFVIVTTYQLTLNNHYLLIHCLSIIQAFPIVPPFFPDHTNFSVLSLSSVYMFLHTELSEVGTHWRKQVWIWGRKRLHLTPRC
jgi:hypothetical protein